MLLAPECPNCHLVSSIATSGQACFTERSECSGLPLALRERRGGQLLLAFGRIQVGHSAAMNRLHQFGHLWPFTAGTGWRQVHPAPHHNPALRATARWRDAAGIL